MQWQKLGSQLPQVDNPLTRVIGRLTLRMMGWRINGEFPDRPKFVVALMPHSSNMDFILTIAVLWYMDGDLEPVNKVEWQTTDGPLTVIDKYGPPAFPSDLQECSTLEARSLRIRARLNGDFGSAYVGHATRPCDYDTFDDFLEIACEKASSETIGRNDLAGDATGQPLSKADEATCLAADGARAARRRATATTTRRRAASGCAARRWRSG